VSGFTREQIDAILAKPGYSLADQLPREDRAPRAEPPQLEHGASNEPLAAAPRKESDPRRFLVVVTDYRRRLLDDDNRNTKWHVDCLRYAGIIPGDSPKTTVIQSRQIQCKKGEERIEIEVSRLPTGETGT
jgi:hypothetical protein